MTSRERNPGLSSVTPWTPATSGGAARSSRSMVEIQSEAAAQSASSRAMMSPRAAFIPRFFCSNLVPPGHSRMVAEGKRFLTSPSKPGTLPPSTAITSIRSRG